MEWSEAIEAARSAIRSKLDHASQIGDRQAALYWEEALGAIEAMIQLEAMKVKSFLLDECRLARRALAEAEEEGDQAAITYWKRDMERIKAMLPGEGTDSDYPTGKH